MALDNLFTKTKKDFCACIILTGLLPILAFTYILAVRVATLRIFIGEIGLIIFFTLLIFVLGIYTGKKMFTSLVTEIIRKDKKAAISELALAVGHEINNPLLAIRGNLKILETFLNENNAPETLKNRFKTIADNFEKIRQTTEQLINLAQKEQIDDTLVVDKVKMTKLE